MNNRSPGFDAHHLRALLAVLDPAAAKAQKTLLTAGNRGVNIVGAR